MTALIQNISIPADNDVIVPLSVTPDVGLDTLEDSTIYWRVYAQAFGIPAFDQSPAPTPLISKSTGDGITLLPSPTPMTCHISILRTDTAGLLRNYYHETTLVDVTGAWSTLNCGILTVTATENR